MLLRARRCHYNVNNVNDGNDRGVGGVEAVAAASILQAGMAYVPWSLLCGDMPITHYNRMYYHSDVECMVGADVVAFILIFVICVGVVSGTCIQ